MAQPIEADLGSQTRDEAVALSREREKAPPFKPPVDIIAGDDAVILEVVLPGVDREDITIERLGGGLLIRGIRRDGPAAERGGYHHVETPRGPFTRAIPVPFALEGDPPIELDRGVLRIRLAIPKGEARVENTHRVDQKAQQKKGRT